MSVLQEPKRVHDLMQWEADERLTRETVTFRQASGSTASYVIGQTLKLSSGKYVPADSTTAAAVLLKNLDDVPTATDVLNVPVLMRGPAILNEDQLVIDASGTKASQVADMLTRFIKAVQEPDNQEEG